ncbi:hypothetical protein [Gracilimonas sp.]|uniref:hypothetical protein n=1 Tax=Gracilimonas sp. TaxID=1974203 RepID=UPI0032F00D9B
MKLLRRLSIILTLLIISNPVLAQNNSSAVDEIRGNAAEARENVKKAKTAYTEYLKNPDRNRSKLNEAQKYISNGYWSAIGYSYIGGDNDVKSYLLHGAIQRAVAREFMKKDLITPGGYNRNAANKEQVTSSFLHVYYNAYEKSKTATQQDQITRDLDAAVLLLSELSNLYVENQDYVPAFYVNRQLLDHAEKMMKIIPENHPNYLVNKKYLEERTILMGFIALNIKNAERITELRAESFLERNPVPEAYEFYIRRSTTYADSIVQVAYTRFPDNHMIMGAILNYFTRTQQYEAGLQMFEPRVLTENVPTIYLNTLGRYHTELVSKYFAINNPQKAGSHKESAISYFSRTLKENPDEFDANANMGILYYQMAYHFGQQLQQLNQVETDTTAQKEWDRLTGLINEHLGYGYPYLVRAEKVNPNDEIVLSALVTIFRQRNDITTAEYLEKRIAYLQNGGKFIESYFKKNG